MYTYTHIMIGLPGRRGAARSRRAAPGRRRGIRMQRLIGNNNDNTTANDNDYMICIYIYIYIHTYICIWKSLGKICAVPSLRGILTRERGLCGTTVSFRSRPLEQWGQTW